jgi:multidrug efflux pump subunit AcrA (membrane-fusion protein)
MKVLLPEVYPISHDAIQYDQNVRGKRLLIGAVLAVLVVAGGVFSFLRLRGGAAATPASQARPTAVFTGSSVSLVGKIEATQVVTVPVPLDGRIDSMPVSVGQEVYEGQLLAQIRSAGLETDRDTASAALNQLRARLFTVESRVIELNMKASQAKEEAGRVRADLDAAQKSFQRQQMLVKEGVGKRLDLEKAQELLETLRARFDGLDQVAKIAESRAAEASKDQDALRKELADRTRQHEGAVAQVASGEVVSPASGLVIAKRGEPGEEVTVEIEDLFTIATNLTALRVVLQPEPPVLAKIKVGQEAIIQVAELPDGILAQIGEVRDGQVLIEFNSPNPIVRPGMTVQVFVKLN